MNRPRPIQAFFSNSSLCRLNSIHFGQEPRLRRWNCLNPWTDDLLIMDGSRLPVYPAATTRITVSRPHGRQPMAAVCGTFPVLRSIRSRHHARIGQRSPTRMSISPKHSVGCSTPAGISMKPSVLKHRLYLKQFTCELLESIGQDVHAKIFTANLAEALAREAYNVSVVLKENGLSRTFAIVYSSNLHH